MKRRKLLQQLVVAGTVMAPPFVMAKKPSDRLGSILPKRTLGKCGERVTCLGLGGFHVGWIENEKQAQAVIEKALEVGIRFFDSAESYSAGRKAKSVTGDILFPNTVMISS